MQVLHLMNKMNLPCPFGAVTAAPPLVRGHRHPKPQSPCCPTRVNKPSGSSVPPVWKRSCAAAHAPTAPWVPSPAGGGDGVFQRGGVRVWEWGWRREGEVSFRGEFVMRRRDFCFNGSLYDPNITLRLPALQCICHHPQDGQDDGHREPAVQTAPEDETIFHEEETQAEGPPFCTQSRHAQVTLRLATWTGSSQCSLYGAFCWKMGEQLTVTRLDELHHVMILSVMLSQVARSTLKWQKCEIL